MAFSFGRLPQMAPPTQTEDQPQPAVFHPDTDQMPTLDPAVLPTPALDAAAEYLTPISKGAVSTNNGRGGRGR